MDHLKGFNHSLVFLSLLLFSCGSKVTFSVPDQKKDSNNSGSGGSTSDPVIIEEGFGNVTKISAGDYYTCALSDLGKVKCWGHNEYGRLGMGNDLSLGNAAGEMGDNLPVVNSGSSITPENISTGYGPYGTLGYENTNHMGK